MENNFLYNLRITEAESKALARSKWKTEIKIYADEIKKIIELKRTNKKIKKALEAEYSRVINFIYQGKT